MFSSALLSVVLMVATSATAQLGRPAELRPIVEPAARCVAQPYLSVAVTGFTPPRNGSVELVVSIRGETSGEVRELGRVAIFPAQRFASDLTGAQRFGFNVPKRFVSQPAVVVVALEPAAGSSDAARATIGEARIGAGPGGRC